MKFSELLDKLQISDRGSLASFPDCDPEISGVAPLESSPEGTLSYIDGARFAAQVNTTTASALFLPWNEDLQQQASDRQIAWVSTKEPRLMFARAIALFYRPYQPPAGIHPTAVIHPTAKLGEAVSIGAHVVIEANVQIGDRVCIHPNVVIYPDVVIGDRTLLHANCVIHERTQIGADCVIHSGAAIGSEGFGFVPTETAWLKMEQSGYTVLEDGVEVGCNSTIDRPAVGETRIGRDSKLDNLVHVAHNCRIGEHSVFAAQVGLAGGAKTGEWVILGGQVGVANLAFIGDRVQAGAKAGIHSSVDPGSVVMGNPATPRLTFLKASAIYNRLPEMHKALKALQQQMEVLRQQVGK
ncbi:MAG: UDP-3-O-(3-hydroxymyristoyl)glucosamine N-acyltransferase [Oculatellaceae cyanobacterium Prado106]|nr:UDP-3-O-(3-hydroxymyristoyl)glucosamine N-acyltransferase [Oculatellaceae cyanobacterium Prado106]